MNLNTDLMGIGSNSAFRIDWLLPLCIKKNYKTDVFNNNLYKKKH